MSDGKTKAETRRRMCLDKKRYKTEQKALSACISASRKFGVMRPYRCPFCNGWHITHHRAS